MSALLWASSQYPRRETKFLWWITIKSCACMSMQRSILSRRNHNFWKLEVIENTGCTILSNLCLKFLIPLVWWRREQLNSNLSVIFQSAKVHASKASSSNDGIEVISYTQNFRIAILSILWFDVGFGNYSYIKEDHLIYNMHKSTKKGFNVCICIVYVLNLTCSFHQICFMSCAIVTRIKSRVQLA